MSTPTNEELLELIIANIPVVIWSIDVEGRFTFVNGRDARIERYLGRSLDELFGDNPAVLEANRQALRGEEHRAVVEYGGVPYDAYYRPLLSKDGKVLGAIGVAMDVSEGQRTLAELRQSEALTRRIIEAVPGGIVLVSAAGEILDANAKAMDFLGLTYDQLTHRFIEDFDTETIHEDGTPFPVVEYPVARCLATRQPDGPATLGVKRRDGTVYWGVFTAVPATHPRTDEFVGAVVTFLDITTRKVEEQRRADLERQLAEAQRLEAIGRLAGGLAHDLNNILSAILGHASLLKDAFPPGTEEHREAATIELAGQRAAKLTHQLLGFARRGKHQNEPIDVDRTVREAIDLLTGTLRKNVRVEHKRSEAPAIVMGDATQLQQVLINLAINAQDAMPDGGDLTFVTTIQKDRGADPRAHLTVSDTGSGISADVQGRIFEPFFTTKESGTGMGLAMVYGIIQNHGGQIRVESERGRGTTFHIMLPASSDQRPDDTEPAARKRVTERKRILIVDDDEIVRTTAALLLKRLGYDSVGASSGPEAIERYRLDGDIALVILDLVMPEMSGRECFHALRELDPKVRALISSGYDRDDLAAEILREGVGGFLQKPYTLDALRSAVEDALS